MLQSVISKIGPRRRIAVLASVCVLATAGTLALIGTASADETRSCSNATFKGTYIIGTIGWSISGGTPAPFSLAGLASVNGAGTGTSVLTVNRNGVVVASNARGTVTYTINADCTGTFTGQTGHFNLYMDPSGESFSFVATDPGSVFGGIITRVTREIIVR